MLDRDYSLLVGTYSDLDVLAHQPYAPISGKGIYAMTLGRDGKLVLNEIYDSLNPAVLIPHNDNQSLYAILETIQDEGTVVHYHVDNQGLLTERGLFKASGRSTCYLSLAPQKDAAIVISYWDAMIDVCEVDSEGRLGKITQSFKQYYRPKNQWRQVTNREDHWVNRQVGPHSHCAHFWHNWVFIPDLGENAVFQYQWDSKTKQLISQLHIEFEPGSGPRHMVIHPTLAICYISNELFNTVCVAKLDASEPDKVKQRLVPIQYESTLNNCEKVSYVSEIRLSPDARFLYVSNRGDDSIAIFKVLPDGRLSTIGQIATGGKFPRHFSITPCGKAVIVANQDSGHIRVFNRNLDTGMLTMTEEIKEIPAPNYIRFINN